MLNYDTLLIPSNDNDDQRNPPAWRYTTHLGKLFAANRALMLNGGTSYAFTLNLSPDEIARAHASRKGFARYFADAITRAVHRRLGRKAKFWIAVDVTPNGRLHLHGGIAITDNEVHEVHDALCHVGGIWANSRHKDKQAFEEPQYDLDGWVRYGNRVRSKVRHLIKGRTYAIANGLIGEARDCYENLRQRSINLPRGR